MNILHSSMLCQHRNPLQIFDVSPEHAVQLNDKIGALEANIGKVTKEAEGLAATHKEELHNERSAARAAQAQLDGVEAEHATALQRSETAKVCPCAAATSCRAALPA